jgi:hypothetical protein
MNAVCLTHQRAVVRVAGRTSLVSGTPYLRYVAFVLTSVQLNPAGIQSKLQLYVATRFWLRFAIARSDGTHL